jgi:lipopolysaccharide export LptBFGC system permease protein LptF
MKHIKLFEEWFNKHDHLEGPSSPLGDLSLNENYFTNLNGRIRYLYHLSFIERHKSIMKEGLKIKQKRVGFGNKNKFQAIYLYDKRKSFRFDDSFLSIYISNLENSDVYYTDIVRYKIDISKLDPNSFIADEDLYDEPFKDLILPELKVLKKDAQQSLDQIETVAYLKNIPKNAIIDYEILTDDYLDKAYGY